MTQTFQAHGKLLLTGEYFVLDGALALALPVKRGQILTATTDFSQPKEMQWKSLDQEGNTWFRATFHPPSFDCTATTDETVASRLQKILQAALSLNPSLPTGYCQLETKLQFPREWGLGTSSTLIYLLAQWAQADPFELQFRTFGGSGYDIACAGADGPVLYRLDMGKPNATRCDFRPPFAPHLYFVFLGKKQDSREGIGRYRASVGSRQDPSGIQFGKAIDEMTALTRRFLQAKTLLEFEQCMEDHEQAVASALGLKRAKDLYFNDFWGEIKSLGAWGGDFVLATSNRPREETRRYFNEKGFGVFLPYDELVL